METGKRIGGMQPDQRGKGRHRCGIPSLQLGEGFGILRHFRRREYRCRQRLVGAERLAAPP